VQAGQVVQVQPVLQVVAVVAEVVRFDLGVRAVEVEEEVHCLKVAVALLAEVEVRFRVVEEQQVVVAQEEQLRRVDREVGVGVEARLVQRQRWAECS